ncbi:MAG: hypothetical protein AAF420_11425, partial [Pseudomonadota bacterium]
MTPRSLTCCRHCGVAVVGFALLAFFAIAHANDESLLPSQLSISFGADEDGGREQSIDLLLNGLPFDASASAGGVATQDGISVANSDFDSNFDSDTFLWGVASDPLQTIEVGFDYSEWDSQNEFTISTRAPWIRLNADDISLSAVFFQRDIDIRLVNDEVLGVESDGYAVTVEWFGADDIWLGASASTHDYSRDVSRINNFLVFIRLSPAARVFAHGLEDRSQSVWIGAYVGEAIADLELQRAVSAVDESESRVLSATVDFPITNDIAINA